MIDTTVVELERLKFCLLEKFNKSEFAIPAKIDFSGYGYGLAKADEIYCRVVVEVFGQHLKPVIIKHPSDWWQALKDRFAPAWVLKRWPVVMRYHQVDFRVLFPTLPDLPGHKRHVHVNVTRGELER